MKPFALAIFKMLASIQESVPLRRYTTFQIGGPAEFFAVAKSEEELTVLARVANERQLALTILGGGSNVLISDKGIKGLVVKNEITGISYEPDGETVLVTAGAGVVWDDLVSETVSKDLWGLENLSAIPGSVGATPIQNVGAYGVEVAELIKAVRVYDKEKKVFLDLTPDYCQFGYRDSMFKHEVGKKYIVIAVTYTLSEVAKPKLHYKDLAERFKGDFEPSLEEIREAVIEIRSRKFPNWHEVGTAGSFFKNPIIDSNHYAKLQEKYPDLPSFSADADKVKVPLGWILDKVLNLRGVREGNVGAYKGQALVIVNHGGATATEVDEFAKKIEQNVKAVADIDLTREVTFVS